MEHRRPKTTAWICGALLLSAMAVAVPPKYVATEKGLRIEGVSPDRPIIYDNDWWTDVPDAAYIWAKASLGKCDLRGNVITRCTFGWEKGYAHAMEEQVKECRKLLEAARRSGLANIPDPVLGSIEALRPPGSGRIEDTAFVRSPGSDLILAEARKASPANPLLVFCGGSCTTVATACLDDPSISGRIIVFQVDGGGYNGSDGWAWKIAMERCRFANWARGYFWDKVGDWDPGAFEGLPGNPLGDLLRGYAGSGLGKANRWGDGAWIFWLFDPRCLTRVEDYDGKAITVPREGTDPKRIAGEFFATMRDPAVYRLEGSSASAENWPCFRGPSRQGVSSETGLPVKWSASEGVLWRTPIPGEAWSSPIVWGDRVLVTTATDEGKSCRILALAAATGKILWDREVLRQVPGKRNDRNTEATPTPCTDGERICAAFGDGSFAAVDLAGNVVWTNRDFPFRSQHGLGTSPILWEGLVIMARDGSGDGNDEKIGWQTPWDRSYVVAIEAATGKVRWKAGRGMSRIAHVVPNIWSGPGGRTEVISGAGDVVQGFDARTGERIWTSKNIGEGVVPSIVLGGDLAFTASGFGGRESIKAFRLGGKGDLGETNLAWEERKASPKVPSYLYLAPYLYTVNDGGVAMCLEGETGKVLWQERLGGTYSASPVGAEGRIYFLSDEGETTVVEAGPRFAVLARNPLGKERVQASMAVSGGRLFIRTENRLVCIGKR